MTEPLWNQSNDLHKDISHKLMWCQIIAAPLIGGTKMCLQKLGSIAGIRIQALIIA